MARIYVADLAAYNAGVLHGVWIDLGETDSEGMWTEVKDMLREGQKLYVSKTLGVHEEWAIQDYEGFGELRIGEHEDLDIVKDLSDALERHGEPFEAWISEIIGDIGCFADVSDAEQQFQDRFIGEISLGDYAYQYAEDVLGLEGTALDYFDYEKFGNDLKLSGDVSEVYYNGTDYLFRAW
ncbi:anti-restriction protein [Mycobacterium phage Chadwick]|uniref:ArdA-like antirestriction protein n=1 Tax=Mycobacterium phage Chadwick TaxID=1698366 RepID=A0A0K2CMP0_9CAUD|nr:anti-restriction protein [Mycobacterium phage Chadwick]ALA06812.1 ArdA-like antirestriction protein [Mycobacterium phage Chadwick]